MAEALTALVQTFEFIEENRGLLQLVGDVRLDPELNVIQLKPDADTGYYPTTGDHYVIGPLFNPKAVRAWTGFQAAIAHIKDGLEAITGEGFRLHDGTDEFWWDSAAWVASTTDWNTEQEIADNIASFPVDVRKLRVVVRLTTTDKRSTPSLHAVKVGWNGKVVFMEDIIYRSLVPQLRDFRYTADVATKIAFPGGSTINLGTVMQAVNVAYNLRDVDSVFDYTDDPDRLSNLLSSYNNTTKIITLSAAIPVGHQVIIQIVVEPEVAVNLTSQDYVEVQKVPALLITGVESVDSSPLAQDDGVVNKGTGDVTRVPAPYRFDIRFSMIALAPGAIDLMRMVEALVGFVESDPFVHSSALDRNYRLWMLDEFNVQTQPNMADIHNSGARFMIKDVLAYKRPATNEKAVQSVKLRGDMSADTPYTP